MEIKTIKIKDLATNDGQIEGLPKNPRQIRDHRYEKLKKSIEDAPEMLQLRELLVYPHGGKFVIIGGNMRYRACKEIGYKELPCKVLDAETPVEKLRQYAIKDNENFGEYDWDIVANEWDTAEMEDWGVELPTDWGVELDGEEIEQKEIVEDEIPENVETKCKKGEIWQLGRHRLMCGDSTDGGDVAKLMNGERADSLFTDPPYGYEYQSNMRTKSEKFDVLKNDDKILDFFPLLPSFVDGWIFVCTTWKVLDMWTAIFKKQYDLTNLIVWDKGGGYIGDLRKTFGTDYEIIMCSNNGKELTGKRLGSVWSIGKDNAEKYDHPTQKPVALSGTAIDCTTNEGDIILDLFGGSGSTMIACEQLGRKCRMMELDPHYCDVIIARWEKLSGGTAVKIKEV